MEIGVELELELELVDVQPRVDDDPGDKEACGARQEPLLGQLPGPAVLDLVNSLKIKVLTKGEYCYVQL